MDLAQEINACCTPEVLAEGNYHAIAALVNEARAASGAVTLKQPTLVGKGTISDVLGIPAGPVFIYTLKQAALTPLPASPTMEQIAQKAVLELAWELINSANFDVGLPSVRQGLDMFAGKLPGFTQESADKIKRVAERSPTPATWDECARALGA